MKPKLVICGNYGAGNVGDEAILRALLQKFKKEYNITVMSSNPVETSRKFKVKSVRMVPSGLRSLLTGLFWRKQIKLTQKAIKECDRFLFGGGTLLTDEPWQSMFVWGAQIETAFKYQKKVEIYANGIGPFRHAWTKKWAAKILERAAQVSVRDQRSAEWVKKLGRSQMQLAKDPVLEWPISIPKCSKKIPKNTVIIVPRFWTKNADKTQDSFKKFIQYLCLKEGKNVIGVPFENASPKDLNFLTTIFEQANLGKRAEMWVNYQDELDVLSAIKQAEIVVGMRLHSLIFAHITKTPFIGISYMEKVQALGEELGKQEAIIDLDLLSFEALQQAYQSISS